MGNSNVIQVAPATEVQAPCTAGGSTSSGTSSTGSPTPQAHYVVGNIPSNTAVAAKEPTELESGCALLAPTPLGPKIVNALFLTSPIFAAMANTLSNVDSISAGISTVPVKGNTGVTCNLGEPLSSSTLCPYTSSVGFMVIWILYFLVFIAYRFLASYRYYANDIRNYLYSDFINSSRLNKISVYVGFAITLASVGAAIVETFNTTTNVLASLTSVVIFGALNVSTLSSFLTVRYPSVLSVTDFDATFPDEVLLDLSAKTLSGALVSTIAFFYEIELAILKDTLGQTEKNRAEMGNPKAIFKIMQIALDAHATMFEEQKVHPWPIASNKY
jgi:hypothetical protein